MSPDLLRLVACAVCFGAADGPLITAARLGVLVMLAVTCSVLAALGSYFIRLSRRAAIASASGDVEGSRV